MNGRRGRFITLEGIDGAGKSTHVEWLVAELQRRGHVVVETREPGGTELGEALREMLLETPMSVATEALLMFTARQENIVRVIEPALAMGRWVLCDRFTDATFAYQGGGKGLSVADLEALERWVQRDLAPDLTFLFDLAPQTARLRRGQARTPDKFEREDEEFFGRVRDAYLARAAGSGGRIRIINADQSIDAIRQELAHGLDELAVA